MSLPHHDNKDYDKTGYDVADIQEVPEANEAELVSSVHADQAYLNASKSTRFFRSSLFQMFMFGA